MKVHELMSTEVVTASAETTLKEVARLMLGHQISGVPILDDDQQLIGIVSEADMALLGEDCQEVIGGRSPEMLTRCEGQLKGGRSKVCQQHVHVLGIQPCLLR